MIYIWVKVTHAKIMIYIWVNLSENLMTHIHKNKYDCDLIVNKF